MNGLVLWDIDGTLLLSGGAGRDVFEVAVRRVLERDLAPEAFEQVRMGGKTDPQIAREVLLIAEVADHDVDRHLPRVLRELEVELAAAADRIKRDGKVLQGVEAVLERLHDHGGILQSVLTGNLAPNAAVKLGAFGLERWLDLEVGAYGSDHHDRRELVAIALEKIERSHGRRFTSGETWVVGDTPRDLECARAGGARCLLVATGHPTYEELAELGADVVVRDLTDVEEIVSILAG